MPEPIRVMIGLMALLLLLVASVFGRVILYAATGRWLQRKYVHVGRNSERWPCCSGPVSGCADVAALRLAVYGGVHFDHQFRPGPHGAVSGWLEIRVICFRRKISINSYAVVFTRQKGQVMRALAFTVISLITLSVSSSVAIAQALIRRLLTRARLAKSKSIDAATKQLTIKTDQGSRRDGVGH